MADKSTFISLMKMTPQGRLKITESLQRGGTVKTMLEKIGVEMKDYYVTLGPYDTVMVFEAPNEKAMAQAMMQIGQLGAVETTTMACIGADDYGDILQAIAADGQSKD